MWGEDRIHLNTEGHARVAQAASSRSACVRRPRTGTAPLPRWPAAPEPTNCASTPEWVRSMPPPGPAARAQLHLVGRGSPGQETEPHPGGLTSSRRRCGASIPPMTQLRIADAAELLGVSDDTVPAAWSSPSAWRPTPTTRVGWSWPAPRSPPSPKNSPGPFTSARSPTRAPATACAAWSPPSPRTR